MTKRLNLGPPPNSPPPRTAQDPPTAAVPPDAPNPDVETATPESARPGVLTWIGNWFQGIKRRFPRAQVNAAAPIGETGISASAPCEQQRARHQKAEREMAHQMMSIVNAIASPVPSPSTAIVRAALEAADVIPQLENAGGSLEGVADYLRLHLREQPRLLRKLDQALTARTDAIPQEMLQRMRRDDATPERAMRALIAIRAAVQDVSSETRIANARAAAKAANRAQLEALEETFSEKTRAIIASYHLPIGQTRTRELVRDWLDACNALNDLIAYGNNADIPVAGRYGLQRNHLAQLAKDAFASGALDSLNLSDAELGALLRGFETLGYPDVGREALTASLRTRLDVQRATYAQQLSVTLEELAEQSEPGRMLETLTALEQRCAASRSAAAILVETDPTLEASVGAGATEHTLIAHGLEALPDDTRFAIASNLSQPNSQALIAALHIGADLARDSNKWTLEGRLRTLAWLFEQIKSASSPHPCGTTEHDSTSAQLHRQYATEQLTDEARNALRGAFGFDIPAGHL